MPVESARATGQGAPSRVAGSVSAEATADARTEAVTEALTEAPTETTGSTARILTHHDTALLARIEDAGLNASAPPQQRWMDGWMVRFCPGKAQRARCVNALAPGLRPVAEKLAQCRDLYDGWQLPFLLRITPFSQPPTLDAELAALGWALHDDTRVMLLPQLGVERETLSGWPAGLRVREVPADVFAEQVGALRGSPAGARAAHAQRLRESPVPYRGVVVQDASGTPLACGQFAQEEALVGLYDVATRGDARRQGLATLLCEHLLSLAANAGATMAYLQVGADNEAARRIYHRMGFVDAYGYHYRVAPDPQPTAAAT